MQDTSDKIKKKFHAMLLKKSGEERMIMGANMTSAAKTMFFASLPENTTKNEKRIKFFLRFYKNDFSLEERNRIIEYFKEQETEVDKQKIRILQRDYEAK